MTISPDLLRALGALCEAPAPAHARIAAALGLPGTLAAADHAELFVFHLPPYASIYLGAEGMLGGEAADRTAGFWRALGLTAPSESDHLAALLGLYAALLEAERDDADPAHRVLRRESRRALLWEHLLSWVVPYTFAAQDVGSPPQRAWARLLRRTLLAEAADLGRPDRLPLQLRAAPGPPSTDDGAGPLLNGLLAPVRSGMILTRLDLARAAGRAGLALRMGERAFVLRSMLAQDVQATLAWLADEACRWAGLHGKTEPALGGVAEHWRSRAESTRTMLLGAGLAASEMSHAG